MLIRTLTASAVVVLAPMTRAQSPLPVPASLESLLPASTYAAARFGGLESCRGAADELALGKLVATFLAELPAEVRERHLERGLDRAGEHVRQVLQHAGLSPADARAVLMQPMMVALGRLSIEGMGPSVTLMIERGQHAEAIDRCASALLSQLPRFGIDAAIESVSVEGNELRCVRMHEGPPLFVGTVGGTFCIGNSRGFLSEVARVAAGRQRGLAAESKLSALRQQLPAQPLASWLINARPVMDSLAPHLPYEAGDFADALGIGQLDLIYWAASGAADLLHVGIGGSSHGLMKALVSTPVDLSFAQACSENTVLFGAGSFDVPAVVDAFQRFAALLPEEAQHEIESNLSRDLARGLRRAGTTPAEVDAMLRAFGGQIGFALSLEKGAVPKPELLLHLSVRDRGPVQALLQRLEAVSAKGGKVEWATRKVGEHELRFCNLRVPRADFQLSPCYVLDEGNLWLATDTAALTRAVRRGDDPEAGLDQQADFRAMAKAAAGQSGVLHLRSFRGVEIGWRSAETLLYPLVDANSEMLGFDSEALPDTETLAEALGVTTAYYRVDDDGVTVRSEGTFVFGALLAALGAAGDEVLQRATGKIY